MNSFNLFFRRRLEAWAQQLVIQSQDPRPTLHRNFSREFGSFRQEFFLKRPVPGCRARSFQNKMADFQGVWGVWNAQRPAGPGPKTYPQVIHSLFTIREFGSLKPLDIGQGPVGVPHITRAHSPRFFGPGP